MRQQAENTPRRHRGTSAGAAGEPAPPDGRARAGSGGAASRASPHQRKGSRAARDAIRKRGPSTTPARSGWTSSQGRVSGRRAGPTSSSCCSSPSPGLGPAGVGQAPSPPAGRAPGAGAGRPPWARARPRRRPPGLAPRQAELAGRGVALSPRLPPAAARVRRWAPPSRRRWRRAWPRLPGRAGWSARGVQGGEPPRSLSMKRPGGVRCWALGRVEGSEQPVCTRGGRGGSRKPARARQDPPQPLRPRPLESSCRPLRAPPLPHGALCSLQNFKEGVGGNQPD